MAATLCCRGWRTGLNPNISRRFSSTVVQAQTHVTWRRSARAQTAFSELTRLSQLHTLALHVHRPPSLFSKLATLADGTRTVQERVSTFSTKTTITPPPLPSSSKAGGKSFELESGVTTAAEQRRNDWIIAKRLMMNVWPKNDWKTRLTVVFGFVLLVTAKVSTETWCHFSGPLTRGIKGFECAGSSDFQVDHRFFECGHRRFVHRLAVGWIPDRRMYVFLPNNRLFHSHH